jgi:hypothetical protein
MITLAPMQAVLGSLPFVSPAFGDHMVLQRDQTDRIWGWTTPGAKVTVTIAGNRGKATADALGRWEASFQPPKAGGRTGWRCLDLLRPIEYGIRLIDG